MSTAASQADTQPLSFQDMILTLHNFWSAQGCLILQPYDMRMGAGTFHPATTLRALGPEPWKAAYVQPSRRPTDGRCRDAKAGRAKATDMCWQPVAEGLSGHEARAFLEEGHLTDDNL